MQTVTQLLNNSLFDPKKFIKSFKKEKLNTALLLYVITLTIATFIQYTLAQLFPTSYYANGMQEITLATLLLGIPSNFILLLLFAAVTHLILKLFESKVKYDRTLVILALASVPSTILSLLPYLGIIASIIYLFGIAIYGIKEVHNVSTAKAITSFLAPFIITILLALLFFVSLISAVA